MRANCVLHIQRPRPNVWCCEITIYSHDRARSIEAIDCRGTVQWACRRIPRNRSRIEKVFQRSVAGRDCAAGGVVRCVNGSSVGTLPGPNALLKVESDKRLPIHGLVGESGATAQYCPPIAADVPCKTHTRSEVLVVRVI